MFTRETHRAIQRETYREIMDIVTTMIMFEDRVHSTVQTILKTYLTMVGHGNM
jgi:hypothetical protein